MTKQASSSPADVPALAHLACPVLHLACLADGCLTRTGKTCLSRARRIRALSVSGTSVCCIEAIKPGAEARRRHFHGLRRRIGELGTPFLHVRRIRDQRQANRRVCQRDLDRCAQRLCSELVLVARFAVRLGKFGDACQLEGRKAIWYSCVEIVDKHRYFGQKCFVGRGWGREDVQRTWDAFGRE